MKKMNKSIKFLSMAFSIALVSVFISCGDDDDPIIIDEDPVVADGFYVLGTATAEEPDADLELALYSVNQTGGVVDMRDGFYGNYFYLNAGTLNFAFYTNNTPTIYGGSVEEVPFEGNADFNYWKGALTEDGTAVTISEAGFYQIHVDLSSSLFFVSPVEYFEIIGSATPDAWNSGQEMPIKAGASLEKTEFEIAEVVLRAGAGNFFKFRYNSNWTNNVTLADESVLPLQTNFGIDGFAGGVDIPFEEEDGVYKVTLTFEPGSIDWALTFVREAEAITYDPAEHPWGVRGTSVDSWDVSTLLTPNHNGTAEYRWYGVILLSAGEFKVTDGATWLGVSGVTDNSGKFTGTDNLIVAEADAGFYYFVVTTSDEGSSYIVTIDKASFGLIGSATAATTGGDGWAADADMTESGTSFSITMDLAVGDIKFRANDAWEYNLGGDLAGLSHNGSNISISTAGSYTVTLTTADRGAIYTATVTQ